LKIDPLFRSDVMRSYGISGHFGSVRLVERCSNPSRLKALSMWTDRMWLATQPMPMSRLSPENEYIQSYAPLIVQHVPGSNPPQY
jgi:hypothetical protein